MVERNREILSIESKANRKFKHDDPEGYLMHRLRVATLKHPENKDLYRKRAEKFINQFHRLEVEISDSPECRNKIELFDAGFKNSHQIFIHEKNPHG